MAVGFFGDYDTTETAIIPFNTFSSDDPSASVTITNLAAADVEIHKDGSVTQRSSDAGVTVSIDFDGITGNHIVSIDLSDNTDAGFYAAGSRYQVRMEGTTIDGATVNAWIGAFSIGCTLRPTTDGRTLDVTATGAAGIDWGNVENKTTANDLTQTDIQLVDTTTTNTDMRGTDNAALASVVGALADAAAAGEVTSADTLMQYIKQLINILIGTPGIGTFPAEAAPGNAVSLAEVIRAIHADVTGLNGSAMRGTDSAALASVVGALADAAAAGEVTSADTLMQYIKQLINILIGAAGIVTWPAAAAPANGVSLAEAIRNINTMATSSAAWGSINSGLIFRGTVTADDPGVSFTIGGLAGQGAGAFTDANTPWYAYVFRDAGGAAAAPQGEIQQVTGYTTATGLFTTAAFTVAVATGDDVMIMSEKLAAVPDIKTVVDTIAADVVNIDGDAMRGTDSAATAAALTTHDGKLDTVDTAIGALNNLSAAQVNAEVDTALNTAVPGAPTANSINERIKAIDDKLPSKTYLSGSADADGGFDTEAKADVNAQVNDVMSTDTQSLPGQEAPTATPTLVKAIMYLYKRFRNKYTQTATEAKIFADDTTTVDQKATISDDATTFTKGEMGTGP